MAGAEYSQGREREAMTMPRSREEEAGLLYQQGMPSAPELAREGVDFDAVAASEGTRAYSRALETAIGRAKRE